MPSVVFPQTPADVSLFMEEGKLIFRVDESRSIYVSDKEQSGVPACYAQCLQQWQPVLASPGSSAVGDWTLIQRMDGAKQWRYKTRPIYTYLNDAPGQVLGEGVDGQWHVVVP